MPHKLLLADDSITIQRVIELTFADEDVQVIVAADGRQAIERARADRPDIVLADISMPERDGYEVAAFIKSSPELSDIPVVLLTGAFEPLDEQRARSVGCDGVLVKPFDPQMVINRVKELLAGRRSTAGAAPGSAAPTPALQSVPAVPRDPETIAPSTSEQAVEQTGGGTLEDYFDRLDAAFANIGSSPGRRPQPGAEAEDLTASLQELSPPAPARTSAEPMPGWDPELTGGLAPAHQPQLANAFAAILAAEEGHGEPDALAALFPSAAPASIPDETIDQIVQRVVARLGDESMRRLVAETAERLVRDEIDRIKRLTQPAEPHPGA